MSRVNPAMSDARAFTNYMSPGLYDAALQRKYGVADPGQYRQFLQRYGAVVRKETDDARSCAPQPAAAAGYRDWAAPGPR